jgi:pantoate--beta-alanine ligase
MSIRIVGAPTVREPDGLAMSSRNQYLSAEERKRSARLFETLQWVGEQLKSGRRDFAMLSKEGQERLVKAHFNPQYLEIRTPDLTAPAEATKEFVILTAAYLGTTRLIDNVSLRM